MKFVQLAKSLKEEGLAPVYLVEGQEAYFRDHAVAAIRAACALTQPALNDVRYEGEMLKGDRLFDFATELHTLPFFDERRLVRIYEFYPTAKEWESVLAPYVQAPCATTVLVIVNTGDKKSELRKKSGVTLVDCAKESEEALGKWLYGAARRAGLSVDGDAAQLMVRYCGYDVARMSLEVKKLALLLGEGGRITRAVVAAHVAKDVEYKLYELTEAVSRGNFSAFSEILHDLMDKGYDEASALGALINYYRTLTELSAMGGTDADVGKVLGLHPYAVKKNREALARLGKARAEEYYLRLYKLSADMRSGMCTKTGALSAAILKIFFG